MTKPFFKLKSQSIRLYLLGVRGLLSTPEYSLFSSQSLYRWNSTGAPYGFYPKALFASSFLFGFFWLHKQMESVFFSTFFGSTFQKEFDQREQPNILIPKFVYKSRREHYIFWELSRLARGKKAFFSHYEYHEQSVKHKELVNGFHLTWLIGFGSLLSIFLDKIGPFVLHWSQGKRHNPAKHSLEGKQRHFAQSSFRKILQWTDFEREKPWVHSEVQFVDCIHEPNRQSLWFRRINYETKDWLIIGGVCDWLVFWQPESLTDGLCLGVAVDVCEWLSHWMRVSGSDWMPVSGSDCVTMGGWEWAILCLVVWVSARLFVWLTGLWKKSELFAL